MNCKPGDLAFVVSAEHRFETADVGKVVLVVGPGDDYSDVGDSRYYWECLSQSGPMAAENDDGTWSEDTEIDIVDSALRPIRDAEGEDEMLRMAGRPEALPATRLAPVDSRSNHPKESA